MRKKFEFCPKRFEPLRRDRVSSVGDKMWRGCLGQTKDPCPRFPDMREGRKRARKPTGVSFTMNVTKKGSSRNRVGRFSNKTNNSPMRTSYESLENRKKTDMVFHGKINQAKETAVGYV